jgi:hypothetical protein
MTDEKKGISSETFKERTSHPPSSSSPANGVRWNFASNAAPGR